MMMRNASAGERTTKAWCDSWILGGFGWYRAHKFASSIVWNCLVHSKCCSRRMPSKYLATVSRQLLIWMHQEVGCNFGLNICKFTTKNIWGWNHLGKGLKDMQAWQHATIGWSDHDWFRLQKLFSGGPPLIVLELKTFHFHLHSFWPQLKLSQ